MTLRKSVFLQLIFLQFWICGNAQTKLVNIHSGYDSNNYPFFIAYNSINHQITGYCEINSEAGAKPQFTCINYFTGTLIPGDKISISFYNYFIDTKATKGWLYIKSDTSFTIQCDEDLPGCWNLMNLKSGESIGLSRKTDYTQIVELKAIKQNLYKAPDESTKLKSYVVQYDPLGVLKEQGNWLQVRYLKNEKIEAWIPKSSVY